MSQTTDHLSLSPSLLHQRLVRQTQPALAYDGSDIATWQAKARQRLITQMGYDLLPADKTPRNIQTLWTREHELGTIEKIAFTSEPESDVLAYLCLPHAAKEKKVPVFICLQGHSSGMHNSIGLTYEEDQPKQIEGDRDFAIGCMKRGIAALCIEQRSFGFRKELHQSAKSTHGCHDAVMHALMLGRTLAAERVHDVACGIEYLKQRHELDMNNLGIMGNSGGGTITLFSCILPEIRLAMPSCGFCTYADSIMSIYHCADNYIPGLLRWMESADVAGLYAPRPLVIVAGIEDPIFPIDVVHKAFEDLKRIYAAAGAPDNVKLVACDGGHRFYAQQAWDAMLPFITQ